MGKGGLDNNSPAGAFILVSAICIALTQGLAYAAQPWAGSTKPSMVSQAAAACMLVQWAAFIPAAICRTEKFFDLTGSLTYISVTLYTLLNREGTASTRQYVASGLVLMWAVRLGTFLFWRISKDGKDGRFDEIKKRLIRFFNVWTIQGAWTFFTGFAVFVVNAIEPDNTALGVSDYVGVALWVIGFIIEVVADAQKTAFKADPANKGVWIDRGLWSYSRHPNYFGEIMLWTGMFVLCCGAFTHGAMWVSIISPLFVLFLLTRVSGIPMLEKRADTKWGTEPEYQRYKLRTSVLIPLPQRSFAEASVKAALDQAEKQKALAADPAPAPQP